MRTTSFVLAGAALIVAPLAASGLAEAPRHLPLLHDHTLGSHIQLERSSYDVDSASASRANTLRGKRKAIERRGEADILPVGATFSSYRAAIRLTGLPDSPVFPVLLDTGSSDLWFEPRTADFVRSPSYKTVSGTDFQIQYAGGAASGPIGVDQIQLGNFTAVQAFGASNSSNVTLEGTGVTGVLGLAFERLSRISREIQGADLPALAASGFNTNSSSNSSIQTASSPFVVKLAQLGVLEAPIFGLSLARTNGTLTLGAIDASAVSSPSELEFYDVAAFPQHILTNASSNGTTSSGSGSSDANATITDSSIYLHWALPFTGLTVNGTNIPLNSTFPQARPQPLALIDSGSVGIYGRPAEVAAIFNLIPTARYVGQDTWAMPCDSTVTMTFAFGGKSFSLGPESYLIGRAQGADDMCLAYPMANNNVADGIDWVLGTRFLENVYAVFSYGIDSVESPKIGFAQSRYATPALSPSSLASFLSALPAAPTTLPNVLISDPIIPSQSYIYNNTLSYAPTAPSAGQLDTTELGASTYARVITAPAVGQLPLVSLTGSQSAPTAVGTPAQRPSGGAARMGIHGMMALAAAVVSICLA